MSMIHVTKVNQNADICVQVHSVLKLSGFLPAADPNKERNKKRKLCLNLRFQRSAQTAPPSVQECENTSSDKLCRDTVTDTVFVREVKN